MPGAALVTQYYAKDGQKVPEFPLEAFQYIRARRSPAASAATLKLVHC
jgi:hypothetical protein